ncbi:MAG: DMT family transporter [Pseudomonadota bacterium]
MTPRRAASPPFAFAVGVLGIALFSGMDALMKLLVLAIGTYNALFWRILATVIIAGTIYFFLRPRRPSREALRIHVVRGAVSAVMAFLFFWGLARVPMAQAIALTYIAPLLAQFLAAVLLKEKLSTAAIGASLVASAGVGVILLGQSQAKMGDEAFLGALAILASAVCYAWNIILMRQQSLVAKPAEVAFYQSLIVVGIMSVAAPWLAVVPAVEVSPLIIASAALATASLALLSWAYARAPANYLAPTEYSSFIWAALFGWLVFGEHVSLFTLAGAALIVIGCIVAARSKVSPMAHEAEAALP